LSDVVSTINDDREVRIRAAAIASLKPGSAGDFREHSVAENREALVVVHAADAVVEDSRVRGSHLNSLRAQQLVSEDIVDDRFD